MAGIKGMKRYSIVFRQMVVDERLKGETLSVLEKKYNVGPDQIVNWVKWFKQYGTPKQITGKRRGRPSHKEETLEEEVKRLRMENEVLKKYRELLYEEMSKKK